MYVSDEFPVRHDLFRASHSQGGAPVQPSGSKTKAVSWSIGVQVSFEMVVLYTTMICVRGAHKGLDVFRLTWSVEVEVDLSF